MKIIITESKAFNVIYNYIDKNFDRDDIDWVYGPNEEGDDWQENPENEEFLIFYKGGTWAGEDYTDIVFNYFTVDYYGDEPSSKSFKNEAPILEVMNEYGEELSELFGGFWVEPMKKWFEDNFNLPVNTVSTYSRDKDED
jgi:hypothetical protein